MANSNEPLRNIEPWVAAFTLVGVLILLYNLVWLPTMIEERSEYRDGMINYSAGNLGYYGLRSDGYAESNASCNAGRTAAQGVLTGCGAAGGDSSWLATDQRNAANDQRAGAYYAHADGFSNGAYEPPVYWPAATWGLLDAYDQTSMNDEGVDIGQNYLSGAPSTLVGVDVSTAADYSTAGAIDESKTMPYQPLASVTESGQALYNTAADGNAYAANARAVAAAAAANAAAINANVAANQASAAAQGFRAKHKAGMKVYSRGSLGGMKVGRARKHRAGMANKLDGALLGL
jgi:hypothetical protein